MGGARHTEEQIAFALRQVESGTSIGEVCRKMGVIESFHGSFRDECLNTHWFLSLHDARRKVEHWRREYNSFRPHSALKNLAPSAFAARFASVHVQPEIPI